MCNAGWLKTVDEYATGGNNSIQYANTGLTIDTVLQSLTENPDRRFIYVEQAFFERWLEEASDQQLARLSTIRLKYRLGNRHNRCRRKQGCSQVFTLLMRS